MKIGLGIGIPRQQSFSGGGGGSPFSPSDISDLELWLEADSGVTGSSPVTAWADQSPVGNDCAATGGGNDPTLVTNALNGNPVIEFDGTDSFITNSTMTASGSDNRTIIFVANRTGGSTAATIFGTGAATTGNEFNLNSEISVRVVAGVRVWSSAALGATWVIGCVKLDGTDIQDLTYYQNGTLITPSSTTNRTLDTTSTVAGIGAEADGTTARLTGSIAAILVYAKALTDEERGNVESYLSTKYGIALA